MRASMRNGIKLLVAAAAAAAAAWYAWPAGPPTPPGPLARVVTLAGAGARGAAAPLSDPFGVAAAPGGAVYATDGAGGRLFRIEPGGPTVAVAAGLDMPSAVAVAPDGALVVANTGAHTVVRVDPATGAVSVVAGEPGEPGARDGAAHEARFFAPVGVAVAPDGTVFVADTYNDRVCAVAADGAVRTLAGGAGPGFADGAGPQARFDTPCGIAVAPDGALVVADTGNHRLRRLSPEGEVTTLFGSGEAGRVDGAPAAAAFHEPTAVAFAGPATLVVADAASSSLRECALGPEPFARTLAGGFPQGLEDGELAGARFNRPTGVAVRPDGTIAVADSVNGLVRAVVRDGARDDPAVARTVVHPPPLGPDEVRAAVAPRWPYDPPEARRELAATFGEIRGDRSEGDDVWLHNGLDVPGRYGETVRAMHGERVSRPIAVEGEGGPRERLRLPLFGYVHMRVGRDAEDRPLPGTPFLLLRDERGRVARVRAARGTRVAAGDALGTLNNQNHVHLVVGPPGGEMNPLAALELPGLVDTVAPVVERVTLAGPSGEPLGELGAAASRPGAPPVAASGPVRLLVEAYDRNDGNAPSRKLGLYRLGYELLGPDGLAAEGTADRRVTIAFDRMPRDPRSGRLVYAEGSRSGATGPTAFVYEATNRFGEGGASEERLDLSALPAGDYLLRVTAEDFHGNRTSVDLPVRVGGEQAADLRR